METSSGESRLKVKRVAGGFKIEIDYWQRGDIFDTSELYLSLEEAKELNIILCDQLPKPAADTNAKRTYKTKLLN